MIERSTIKVLVVDDDEPVRESLAGFLDDCGFDVSLAESAEEALAILARTPHDVAIIDLRLPGMSGESLILKVHEMAPGVRYLIYTGSSGYRLSEELAKIGLCAEHVFLKPQKDLMVIVEGVESLIQDGSE